MQQQRCLDECLEEVVRQLSMMVYNVGALCFSSSIVVSHEKYSRAVAECSVMRSSSYLNTTPEFHS